MSKVLENRIQLSWKKMTKKERELSEKILESKSSIGSKTISELSIDFGVSPSSINRWSKKLGFEGFKDLSANLRIQSKFINKYSDEFSSTQQDVIYSVSTTEHFLNYDDLEVAANKIIQLKKIIFYGESFTHVIASYFSQLFNKIGITSTVTNIASDIALINDTENAVNIFVSISGRNPNISLAFQKAKFGKKIFSVIVSTNKDNTINNDVNCSLIGDFYQSEDIDPYELPIISKTSIDYILQKLFLLVYQKGDKHHYQKLIESISKTKV